MYYIADNNVIKLYNADKEIFIDGLTAMPQYADLPIQQTDRNIILLNGAFVFEDEHLEEILEQAKITKKAENTEKAKLAVENGHVVFKGAEFETNAQTVGDLTATMLLMQAGDVESYLWLSKDDQAVELSLEDFGTLGGLIAEFKNTIWQEKYIAYKAQIESATSAQEVENIEIEY